MGIVKCELLLPSTMNMWCLLVIGTTRRNNPGEYHSNASIKSFFTTKGDSHAAAKSRLNLPRVWLSTEASGKAEMCNLVVHFVLKLVRDGREFDLSGSYWALILITKNFTEPINLTAM